MCLLSFAFRKKNFNVKIGESPKYNLPTVFFFSLSLSLSHTHISFILFPLLDSSSVFFSLSLAFIICPSFSVSFFIYQFLYLYAYFFLLISVCFFLRLFFLCLFLFLSISFWLCFFLLFSFSVCLHPFV